MPKLAFLIFSTVFLFGFFNPNNVFDVLIAPIPFLVALWTLRFPNARHPGIPWFSVWFVPLFVICFFIGLMFASTESAPLYFMHGLALLLAVVAALFWLGSARASQSTALALLVSPTIAATWSLWCIPAAVTSSAANANGSPFCVALHGDGREIGSIWDLRGFTMYTVSTGYKSTSNFFFHGVALVQGDEGLVFYNWSPAKRVFDRLELTNEWRPELSDLCEPQQPYWTMQSVF